MNVTKVVRGASRLPLTSKRANKDYYKGSGQAYVPGGGHRTGPPGKHVIGGKAKFRVMDDKVRYYVGPGAEILDSTDLKPYVARSVQTPEQPQYTKKNPPISFSPNIHHQPISTVHPKTNQPLRIKPHDTKTFAKWYRALSHEDRTRVVAETRKTWYETMVVKGREVVEEEAATREVEAGAQA
ncbi:hypothetical protein HD553DRAFT_287744 [Filobasidium floriforme]|uniref:uncharacterized protein n=1 Tax=Filobasidium floriforme TaxID=5210 RepID=UPI001E8EA673|nr:uncharacterized protein HD553DRAFT_287744 [Filobasidium floriforme]KAH8080838.1 hypothetical protein HD553DRAFT_287744 [Filobasidium floriforme]